MTADVSDRLARIVAAQLHRAGIRATVTDRIVSSRVVTVALRLRDPADLPAVLRMGEPLAVALGADSVRVARSGGRVLVEVAHPAIPFRPLAADAAGNLTAVVMGRDTLGFPVTLDLAADATPHCLIAGTTGSGKTTALVTLIAGLARQNSPARLRILAAGDTAVLAPLSGLPHLLGPVMDDPAEGAAALDWLAGLLEERAGGWDYRIIVVIDEVQHLLAATGGPRGSAARQLAALTARGRSRGIHCVLATQTPTVDVIGGTLAKANLPCRLVGRVTDAHASTLATGQAGCHAEKLSGQGDFIMVTGANVRRFQVAVDSLDDLPQGDGDHVEFSAPESIAMHPASARRPVTDPQVAWACQHGKWWGDDDFRPAGVDRIRQQFGPMGQTRAARIRDAAAFAIATGGYLPYRVPENVAVAVTEGGE